jgi:hypothetical protein
MRSAKRHVRFTPESALGLTLSRELCSLAPMS